MNWRFADDRRRIVVRTLDEGTVESCLVEAIADWIAAGNLPGEPEPPRVVVPLSVSKRQAKQALLDDGKLDAVEALLAQMPGIEGRRARIEWEDSQVVERHRPLTLQLAAALGLTDAQIDQLFITAATL